MMMKMKWMKNNGIKSGAVSMDQYVFKKALNIHNMKRLISTGELLITMSSWLK